MIRVHGLDLSYFTGKIEAYLRCKGLDYDLVELDTRTFREIGKRTGLLQMPALELPDGRWLSDTPQIIDALEAEHPLPALLPAEPVAAFAAHLLEAYGDEHLWRPALFYRWAFAEDARLMSGRIAAGMLRDVPAPLALRRQIILRRQRDVYLKRDGVNASTAAAIAALYLETLDALETALAGRDFLQGARPTRADLGFFGGMFRHFFCDPTPAKLMRDRAPLVLAWVARMWAISPAAFAAAEPCGAPSALNPIAARIGGEFLPYLKANAAAVAAARKTVRWAGFGAAFETPASPYRAWRLARLQKAFATLGDAAQAEVAAWIGADGAAILASPQKDVASPDRARVRDRSWRPA